MQTIEILPMTIHDFTDTSGLFLEAFAEELGEPWTKETSYKAVAEEFHAEYSFIAKENGKVIGALVGSPSTYEHGTELWIGILVVSKAKRGKGVGKKLFKHATQFARQKGLVGLRLDANPKLKSFNWYHKLGFQKSGWVELVKFFDENK